MRITGSLAGLSHHQVAVRKARALAWWAVACLARCATRALTESKGK